MRNRVIFDTETTGTDVNSDRIVEISLIKTDTNFNIIKKFHSYVNPGMSIPKGASDVHGITDEMVQDAPYFYQIANEIHEFVSNCDLGGYNSNRFDIPLLSQELSRCGINLDVRNIDIVDVYKIESKYAPNTLSEVYKRHTGKELEGAHGAESDTLATIEVLKHQIEKYGVPNNFKEIEDIFLEGKPRLDLGGRLKYIDGVICWGFGKHFDKPLTTDRSYINWCLGQDFPEDFKTIIRKYL